MKADWKEPSLLVIVCLVVLGVVVADAVADRLARARAGYDRPELALAEFYDMTGSPGSALRIISEISEREDRPARLEIRRAALMVESGRLAEAADIYMNLLKRSSRSPLVEFNLAMVLHRMGRAAEAESLLRDFVREYGETLPLHAAHAAQALDLLENAEVSAGR